MEQAIGDLNLGELHRRCAKVETKVKEQVLGLALEVERFERQIEGMKGAQTASSQRLAVIESGYKFGRGSTAGMIGLWQAAEVEKAKVQEFEVGRSQVIQKLAGLAGFDGKVR